MTHLLCCSCKESKPLASFSKDKSSKRGYASKCKDCHNTYVRTVWYPKNKDKQVASVARFKTANRLKEIAWRHGVPLADVEEAIERSSGACESCGSTVSVVLDHCHTTSKVRGVLCMRCNTVLGRLGDSYESVKQHMESLLAYLEKSFAGE